MCASSKAFKFEDWWILELSFEEKVTRIWRFSKGDFIFKLEICDKG